MSGGKALFKNPSISEQTLSRREPGLDSDFYLSLPEDVSGVKWNVAGGGHRRERGQRRGQFYLTGDHNLTTETHTEAFMWRCMSGPHAGLAAQTKVTKYQRGESDRQEAYLYQTRSHC